MRFRALITSLAAMILLVCPATLLPAPVIAPQSGALWVAHPDDPGTDIPRSGQSLFDRIFRNESGPANQYAIPFPFQALIAHLEGFVVNNVGNAVPHVMIPIGRSLQRAVAAPDYFKFPRHIISLEGEGKMPGSETSFAVKNRLFIAYQEKAHQLEVISYNNEAGRFEFQSVQNYDASQDPTVEFASRATCMSCHQNGGPIFSKSPWDETNFNAKVAIAIARARPDLYAGMLDAIAFDASLVDIATDYANYLNTAQLIWRQGCGGSTSLSADAVRCRAGFLNALLQFRLSGGLAFDEQDASYLYMQASIARNWQELWPGGLLTATADIPDVNPFAVGDSDPLLDPLVQRAPKAHWREPGDQFLKGLVRQQSSALVSADDHRLDQQLLALSESRPGLVETIEQPCTLISMESSDGLQKLGLRCGDFGDSDALHLDLDVQLKNDAVVNSLIHSIRLPDGATAWRSGFESPVYQRTAANQSISSVLRNTKSGLSARLSNGNRLHRIRIVWGPDKLDHSKISTRALVALSIVNDYRYLAQAIDRLAAENLAGRSDALGSLPFRRSAILPAVFEQLDKTHLNQ